VLAQLAADSPDIGAALTAEPLLIGGPDVARVLAPFASAEVLRDALVRLLQQRTPSVETAETAEALIDRLGEAPPKLLTAAAQGGHVTVVAALLRKFSPAAADREAARLAAENAHAYACAALLAA
jgi:hypothetical protein